MKTFPRREFSRAFLAKLPCPVSAEAKAKTELWGEAIMAADIRAE